MTVPIRILYIEDDPGVAELLRSHLTRFDWVVTLAVDGESGLQLCSTAEFDVILIDQTLPGMSGLDVIRKLHENEAFPSATIMVTGTGDEDVAVAAMKAGADDYIVKNVDGAYLELLPQVIDRALERRQLRQNQKRLMLEQEQLIDDLRAFSYGVAHDLKQPLSVLQTSSQLLERYIEDQNPERAKRKLANMQETIVRMEDTLDALILFARIRETNTDEFEAVDMLPLVYIVRRQLSDMIEAAHAEVVIPDQMPKALGYAPWIERIWVNYLTNALKYGGTPPHIEIGASPQANGMVSYWVKDNGTGLTPDELGQLFLPFSRLRERNAEGHGLGLAIVKRIARRLRGEAVAVSVPGEGSTFIFTLRAVSES